MNLALKYRPKQFSDVVGQKAACAILNAMIAKDRLSQVLLFTGPSGVGKTSMARIIAAQLNSEGAEDVHAGTHPCVREIDGASNGSVDAIRSLKRSLQYAFVGNQVVIIDEVHSISGPAFDALKEMLEFPPANVTFILCTTEVHEIEPAIRHRCDRYNFKRASIEDLVARIWWVAAKENIALSNELVDLIAQRSEGSYREALMLLEQIWLADIKSVEEYNELQGEVDFGPGLIRSALDGPVSALNQLESVLRYTSSEEIVDRTVETLKDIMVLKGGISLAYSGDALASRLELASKIGTDKILKAMRIVWDLQTKLNAGDPVRGLELAYSLIGEVFDLGTNKAPVVAPKPARATAMTLEDMQKYQG